MTTNGNNFGVIFDMDGVLVDTARFHKQSWQYLAAEKGFEMSDEFFQRTFGMQNKEIIPMMVKRKLTPEQIDQWGQCKEQHYRQLIAGNLDLQKGVRELILELKDNNFRLAIGSSAPYENVEFMLKEAQAWEYFDQIACSQDVKHGKPAPDTFLKAARKLSLTPARCVVIEDAAQGVQAGKAAGMMVVAITSTRRWEDLAQADVIIDCMTELTADDLIKLLSD